MSVHHPSPRSHRDLREEAARVVASTTPREDLAAVIRIAPRLRLVANVDAPSLGGDAA